MKKLQPTGFIKEVRQETAKVTWPSRREVLMSTLMVLIIVSVASVFFLAVDAVLLHGVQLVLGLGS